MQKNSKNTTENNLLKDNSFIAKLVLEANYAVEVKGGHTPFYQSQQQLARQVSKVNLLTPKEQQSLIFGIFIANN